jgi:hypothetical protein
VDCGIARPAWTQLRRNDHVSQSSFVSVYFPASGRYGPG